MQNFVSLQALWYLLYYFKHISKWIVSNIIQKPTITINRHRSTLCKFFIFRKCRAYFQHVFAYFQDTICYMLHKLRCSISFAKYHVIQIPQANIQGLTKPHQSVNPWPHIPLHPVPEGVPPAIALHVYTACECSVQFKAIFAHSSEV